MQVNKPTYRLLLLCLLSALFSCSQITQYPSQQNASNAYISHFRIEGKIGVKNNQHAQSAFLKWQQSGQDYKIQLHGPFGKGRVQIQRQNNHVKLIDGTTTHEAASAEELLYKVSGIQLPVQHLPYWVQGRPSPKIAHATPLVDEQKKILELEQAGSRIRYLRYRRFGAQFLPEKLIIEHTDYRLTLVIKKWALDH